MRPFALLGGLFLLAIPSSLWAQTVANPVYAREAHRERPPATAVQVVPDAVPKPIITQRPVDVSPSATPTAVVAETFVAPARVPAWWEPFTVMRYGYYDDGYLDDNWFYDYYQPASRVVIARPTTGYRTGWVYEPLVERGLFSW